MFENIKPPEDMFEGTEPAVPKPPPPTGGLPPVASRSVEPLVPPPQAGLSSEVPSGAKGGFPWKAIIVVFSIIIIVGAAGAISYFILSSRTPPTPAAPEVSEPTEVPTPTPTPTPTPVEEPPIVTPTPTPTVVPEPDTDQDGLSDAQEAEIGTSPTSADTDADGLFDREEVMAYKTNPLNPDTDGDTYLDGAEVKNGYNPNGPGKLFEVPQ